MAITNESLINSTIKCKVSSVLENKKQFRKENMFDGNDETCWNSGPTTSFTPQWILIDFNSNVSISSISITFQGGFSSKDIELLTSNDENSWQSIQHIYPDDSSHTQTFKLEVPTKPLKFAKLLFLAGTDFYGRITIYSLDILGNKST